MGQQQSIRYTAHVPWLREKALNVYTQFGEDGLIATALQKIGETNRHCFEIGAADGRFFSNTLRLREEGWKAVLIESDQTKYNKLQAEYGGTSICIHATVSDLDAALRSTDLSTRPDLGIIDIDGQDYWMWDDLVVYRPRIMLVEIGTSHHAEPPPERSSKEGQAGLDAIKWLGELKGYEFVAETFCNALFIDKSEL